MIFKILIVGGGIYLLYRWTVKPAIEAPEEEKQEDEWVDYEEVD